MQYFEFRSETILKHKSFEVLSVLMEQIGFEGFWEDGDAFVAYLPAELYNDTSQDKVNEHIAINTLWAVKELEDKNWNAAWEESFDPVIIGDQCYIHAPFHPEKPDIPYSILIEPKMSFGTGHHDTTSMMVSYLLEMELEGKSLLDMGCGTAVLAILAKMRAAGRILAIDNDEWAYNNSIENAERNNASDIEILLGDAGLLGKEKFDIVLANINRNILLNDMGKYSLSLKKGADLLISGFFPADIDMLRARAKEFGLKYVAEKSQGQWAAVHFIQE